MPVQITHAKNVLLPGVGKIRKNRIPLMRYRLDPLAGCGSKIAIQSWI